MLLTLIAAYDCLNFMVQHEKYGGVGQWRTTRTNADRSESIQLGSQDTSLVAGMVRRLNEHFARPLLNETHSSSSDKGRYEYRIWPRLSHPSTSFLHRHWHQVTAERRTDIYLLHPENDRVLIKLRGGERLEIKVLQQKVGTVEYWTMPFSSDFPLTVSVRQMVADTLPLRRRLPETLGSTPANLLAALDPSIVPVSVRKSRLLFHSGDCQAEICRVAVDDWTGHTIALEAPDIPTIAGAIDALKFGNRPNRSYRAALVQICDRLPCRRSLTFRRPGAPFDRRPHAQG